MREILFRGKRVDNGEWIEGGYAENGGKTFIIVRTRYIPDTRDWDTVEYYENNPCYHLSMIEVDPETVCQYTGLTDKNGRKIFEGDIITYQHDNDDFPFPNKDTKRRVGRVYFQEFRSCFAVAEGRNGSDMINQDLFKYVQNGNRVQVIGNIFDNPELIGEQP